MVTELIDRKLDAGFLPLKWENDKLQILDQRCLPQTLEYFPVNNFEDSCFAIKDMVVRGAPSIGVTAAYGFALEACMLVANSLHAEKPFSSYEQIFPYPKSIRSQAFIQSRENTLAFLARVKERLDATRPTAVNLRWGTDKMLAFCQAHLQTQPTFEKFADAVLAQAHEILDEHIQINIKLSDFGMKIVPENANFITHCNAGPLAACGWGTALGVIRSAHAAGLNPHVYVDETRPRNQGAKLTMWELIQDKIPATLICDNMSGFLMSNKKIDLIVVGADRIARNGDAANKIGTFNLAIIANYHKVPFYVAAPLSTFDGTIFSGNEIPIEERSHSEMTVGAATVPVTGETPALNPAFDVTPNQLIAGIITEAGILRAPYNESIGKALGLS